MKFDLIKSKFKNCNAAGQYKNSGSPLSYIPSAKEMYIYIKKKETNYFLSGKTDQLKQTSILHITVFFDQVLVACLNKKWH